MKFCLQCLSMFRTLGDGGGGGGGVCVWGGGGGEGLWELGGNCGIGMRASISKPTLFIYLAFEKNGPFHILERPKC